MTVGGFDPSDAEERRIVSSVVDQLRITPEVKRIPAPNGKRVLSLTVRKSPTLVAFQGRYLTRVGASNRDMTQDEIARRSLEVSGQTWDALPSGAPFRLDGNDPRLSPEALDAFLRLAGPRLPHASANDSQERILENLNLVTVSPAGRPCCSSGGDRRTCPVAAAFRSPSSGRGASCRSA